MDVASGALPHILRVVVVPPFAREILLQRLAALRAVVLRVLVVALPAEERERNAFVSDRDNTIHVEISRP